MCDIQLRRSDDSSAPLKSSFEVVDADLIPYSELLERIAARTTGTLDLAAVERYRQRGREAGAKVGGFPVVCLVALGMYGEGWRTIVCSILVEPEGRAAYVKQRADAHTKPQIRDANLEPYLLPHFVLEGVPIADKKHRPKGRDPEDRGYPKAVFLSAATVWCVGRRRPIAIPLTRQISPRSRALAVIYPLYILQSLRANGQARLLWHDAAAARLRRRPETAWLQADSQNRVSSEALRGRPRALASQAANGSLGSAIGVWLSPWAEYL